MDLPLVAKDTIKEALMSVLSVPDIETSRQLGRAAIVTMLAVAAQAPLGAVIDCNFLRSASRDDLRRLPGSVVEVFCRCDRDVAIARYRQRSRGPGHFDAARTTAAVWPDEACEPVAGGWPVLEVDTGQPVELAPVLAFCQR